jgi:uncharacterized protein YutE (UPF0331/DUF86 family)
MVDEEVVRARLERMERALTHLRTLAKHPTTSFVASWDLHGLAERDLQIASQACVDIANHLIAAEGLRTPDGYADAFQVLSEAGILDPPTAESLKPIAGLRNILVHDYLSIDHTRLHSLIQDLTPFTSFAASVRTHVWP